MREVIIVEVGSTATKVDLCREDGYVKKLGDKYIPFKTDYKKEGFVSDENINLLCEHISSMNPNGKDVLLTGTSIFRELTEEELLEVNDKIENRIRLRLEVITQAEENEYTTHGAMSNVNLDKKIGVIIMGGGSTEISIHQPGKDVVNYHLDFGVVKIVEEFEPISKEVNVGVDLEDITDWIKNKINIKENVDIAILAGGLPLKFAQIMKFNLVPNTLFKDENQPSMISIEDYNKGNQWLYTECDFKDHYHLLDLDKNWWKGARGAQGYLQGMAEALNAEIIIPTNINMIIGLSKKYFEESK